MGRWVGGYSSGGKRAPVREAANLRREATNFQIISGGRRMRVSSAKFNLALPV